MNNYQHILFPYAYNILGSAEDAKDAIQDVILKYTLMNTKPENEKNYLIKGVINQSINIKRKKKNNQPLNAWLPEPVFTESSTSGYELKELLSYSLLFLLERLNPKERAVFILKEAFDYTHEEIAELLLTTTENSRKLLSRASKKIQQKEKQVFKKNVQDYSKQTEQLVNAIRNRDLNILHNLLSEKIAFYADGGSEIKVVKKYCMGIEEVAELLVFVHHKFQLGLSVKTAYVNHQPALLYYDKNKLTTCQIFEFDSSNNKIININVVLDPMKLKTLQLEQVSAEKNVFPS